MKKRRLLLVILISILMVAGGLIGFADVSLPAPTNEFYVGDYAGVISAETKSRIIQTNLNYETTKEKPQIVVATVPNLQGLDVETYAVRLFEAWKIGNRKYDNGVLLLLAVEDRKVRIEVGYGLEGALPDGLTGQILDQVTGDLRDGNYSVGLEKAFYMLAQEVNKEYEYTDEVFPKGYERIEIRKPKNTSDSNLTFPPFVKIAGIIIVLLLLWLDFRFLGGFITGLLIRGFFSGGRGGRGGGFGGSSGGGGRSGGGGSSRGF